MKAIQKCSKLVLMIAVLVALLSTSDVYAAATKNVKIGTTISVAQKKATYESADTSIASVNADGRVTGKKIGTTTITIEKNGKKKTQEINVVANGKMKSIKVSADEIVVSDIKTKIDVPKTEDKASANATPAVPTPLTTSADASANASADASANATNATSASTTTTTKTETPAKTTSKNNYAVSFTIVNNAEFTAKSVVVEGVIDGKKFSKTIKKLKAGQDKVITIKGTTTKTTVTSSLKAISVVSNDMISKYNVKKDKLTLDYATEDETAPTIKGWVGDNSYNDKIPYRIVYADKKDSFDFTKYVTAEDDRDAKVKVEVDLSKVDFKKTGTYTITYTAEDKSGNEAKVTGKIGVRVTSMLDQICDSVLKSITKPGWSDTQKARAIYNYTRGHISYTGSSNKSSWENEAIRGIRYGNGDCFTYYAVARALLTKAGIPNIEVTRVQGHGHHWWNMVYVQGGWYHFDCTPRTAGGRFCLLTDGQLSAYSSTHGHSHIWAYSKKPKSGTKILSHY